MVMSALTAITKSTQSHSMETKMEAIWHEFLSAGESGIIESRDNLGFSTDQLKVQEDSIFCSSGVG
jgi:hypothetical protein